MNVYIPVFLIILLICFLNKKKANTAPLIQCFLLIFLMMGFRSMYWGGDSESYFKLYNYFHYDTFSEVLNPSDDYARNEFLFRLLCFICPTYRFFIFTESLIVCIGLFFFFKKFVPKDWLWLGFTFLFWDSHLLMGDIATVRNGMAIGIFLFGVYFLSQGKILKYCIAVYIASLFHTSAIMFLPLAVIAYKPKSIEPQKLIATAIAISFISFLTPASFISAADDLLAYFGLFDKYAAYSEDMETYKVVGKTFMDLIVTAPLLVMLIPTAQVLGRKDLKLEEIILLRGGIVFYIMSFLPVFGLSDRLFYYINYFLVASACIVMRYKPEWKTPYIACCLVYYGYYLMHFIATSHFQMRWLIYTF